MARDFARAFYNSKEWESVREYIRMRDNYLCVKCGMKGDEVHHITPLNAENIFNPEITLNPSNLQLLCRGCHIEQHKEHTATAHIKDEGRREVAEGLNGYTFDENGYMVKL